MLIVNFETTNLNRAIIFVSQIEFTTKFKLAIDLKNTMRHLIKNFVKAFLKSRNLKVNLLLFMKLLC